MKTTTLRIFILFILLGISIQCSFGTSYQWVGSTNTSWATSSNWSPSGVPDSADNVTISSGTYNLLLDQNRRVTNLTLSNKTVDLNSYSLTVYGTATMTSGTITNGTFYARGTLAAFNGTLMDCPVDAVCGYIRLSGSTFNETADFTDTGTATGTGTGGCTFNDNVTITHGGTLTYFTLANTTGDTFNGNVTFTNNSNRELYVATNGATQFKGNIILNSTSTGGISFGNGTGSSTLDTGKTITIGTSGFAADFLTLKNFTQSGSTAQTLTLTGTAAVNMSSTTFNGNLTVSAPGFLLKNSTFNGTGSFTKTGTGNHQSDGGNVFNGAVTLANNCTSGRIRMATVTADTYNSDATFNSTGQDVQIAYLGNNHFAGNITINSNKVVFNTSTGKVTFTGTNNQTLNGSYNYPFKKLAIDKTSGTVTAITTLSVDDSLIFIQGKLITTSTNLLTMKHGSTSTGASNNSFVSGPVKKVGNTAFVFDVGSGTTYRPLTITAPSNTTDAFTAEYFNTGQTLGSSKDTTITFVSDCSYWKLDRNAGSSNITPKFAFDSLHCDYLTVKPVHIALWNGTKWTDKGEAVTESNNKTTSSAMTSYGYFAFAYNLVPGDAPQYPLLAQTTSTCNAMNVVFNQKEFWISFNVDSAYFKIALFSPDLDSLYAPIEKMELYENYLVGQNQQSVEAWVFECDSLLRSSIRKTAELDTSKQYMLKISRYIEGDCSGISDSLDHFLSVCLMNIRTGPTCTIHTYDDQTDLLSSLGDNLGNGGSAIFGDMVVPVSGASNLNIALNAAPLIVEEGIILAGNYSLLSSPITITSLNPACPSLTYQITNPNPYGTRFHREVKVELPTAVFPDPGYMFIMQGESRIQNLKLIGGLPGYQDYNEDTYLSACIKVEPGLSFPSSIYDCDISKFSYTTIFMESGSMGIDLRNNFIHRIKGSGGHDTRAKGYGMWFQGINQAPDTPPYANISNCYFDECKTALDDQGYFLNISINNCTFGQFFNQETLNRHNNNAISGSAFQHPPLSNPANCLFNDFGNPVPTNTNFEIIDLVDGDYLVENNIFYKKGNVITIPYPGNNQNDLYQFNLKHNTFAESNSIVPPSNGTLYARVADNNLDGCVWVDDKSAGNFDIADNTHNYVPGMTITNSAVPVVSDFSFDHISGSVPGFSPSTPEIPYINQGDYFEVALSAPQTNAVHILRAHPSNNGAIGGANHNSGNNAYDNAEVITNPSTSNIVETFSPTATEPRKFDTSKPGLYGVDLISVNASNNNFRGSPLKHKPIIVAPTNNHLLIFNIKDSYFQDSYLVTNLTSDVFKQVELNGQVIWKELIQLGGDDWEQVVIDLYNGTSPSGDPIKDYLDLNGKNTISFSIAFAPNVVSCEELRGLNVWVDDVYLKKFDSPENLIKDGDIENSEVQGLSYVPSSGSLWYQLNSCAYSFYSIEDEIGLLPPLVQDRATSEARISILERKSGTKAIQLTVDGLRLAHFYPNPITYQASPSNNEIVSAAIDFDIKYFLGCSEVAAMSGVQEITNSDIVGTKVFDDGKYIIRQPLNVEQGETVELVGSSFFMDASNGPVSITVEDGGFLKIYNGSGFPSRLFACEEMWDGIVIEAGGKVEIYPSSTYPTEIHDAITAIEVESGNTFHPLNIRYALFDHNYVGLRLADAQYYNSTSINDGLIGIDFKCTGGKIQKQPFSGLPTYSHIQLEDVSNIQIGGIGSSPSGYTNTFSDAVFGIRCNKSSTSTINGTISIANCSFNNMINELDGQPPSPLAGCGIFAQSWSTANTALNIVEVASYKNEFSNSQNGIILNGNITSIIKGNEFSNLTQGIRLFANNNPAANPTSVTISDENNFYHVSTGILANRMRCPMDISNNQFSNTDYNPVIPVNSPISFRNTAITIQNPSSGINDVVNVVGNFITDYRIGIHAVNIDGIGIHQNGDNSILSTTMFNHAVGFSPNQFFRGIWLQWCNGAFVSENLISNANEITGTTTSFRGIDVESSVRCRLNCNAISGIPICMHFFGSCDGSLLRANEFSLYDEAINLDNATLPPQVQWNDIASDLEPLDNVWNDPPVSGSNPPTDRVTSNTTGNPINWYYRPPISGTANPFNPLDQMSSSFVSAVQDNPGTVYCNDITDRVVREIRFGPIVGDSLEFESFEVESTWMARKYAYECMKLDTTILYQDSLTDAVYQDFFQREDSLNTGKFSIIRVLSSDSATFGSAESMNEQVFDEIDLETYLKFTNQTYFDKVATGDTLNSSDTTALLTITDLPYYSSGEAFYMSIGMLGLEKTPYIPVLRMGQEEAHKANENPNTVQSGVLVYPNPASHSFNIQSKNWTFKKVEVYDSKIQLVQEYKIIDGHQNFPVLFKPGIYGVKIVGENNEIRWFKLIIL